MYCFFCGTENKDDNQYCIKCGKSLHPKLGGDEISVNTGKKRIALILTAVFTITVLAGIAICLVLYNKHNADKSIAEEAAVENVANIKERSTEDQSKKNDDNKNEDKSDTEDDSVNADDGETVPTAVEKKYIEEADKFLAQDDPLSAAEVLTAAMEEDYYPTIYEKYIEIKKNTRDYEEHEIGNTLDGSSYEQIYITEYEDDIKKKEYTYYIKDGEKWEDKTTEYSQDENKNSIRMVTDNINNSVTRYVTVEEEDAQGKILTEYLGDVGDLKTKEYRYVDDRIVSIKSYSETKGDFLGETIYQYDENGFKVKEISKYTGDKPPQIIEYQNDKYGRAVMSAIDTVYYINETNYEYNATGYTKHEEVSQKKDVNVPEGNHTKSSYECEYDALGGAMYSESRVWQSDGSITGSDVKYTHDYHYYSGNIGDKRTNQPKSESKKIDNKNALEPYDDVIKGILSGKDFIVEKSNVCVDLAWT